MVAMIKQKKVVGHLENIINEIRYNKENKPIKYLFNKDKDEDALQQPLMLPVYNFTVQRKKETNLLNLKDTLEIDFLSIDPLQVYTPFL